MALIAFRTEYQITVEPLKNRLCYKVFSEMQDAAALPHYLADWAAALDALQPGFTILTDVSSFGQSNPSLLPLYVATQQLITARRVAMVAEIYRLGSPSHDSNERISQRSGMPVRTFVDSWEADKFLDKW